MTTKLYTDLGQSRKLAEFLPIESADMWYHGHGSPWESEREFDSDACPFHSMRPNWDIPCWSLVGLLNILPSSTLDSSDDHHYRVHCKEMFTDWYDNPIDACVVMIDRLHKQMIYDFNNS